MRRRTPRTPYVRAATVAALLATAVSCSGGAREGTLVSMTAPLPTVTCSAGVGGSISITNISSALMSIRIGWTFNEPADPDDFVGLYNPFRPSDPPPTSVTLSAPPWSSTQDSALLAPSVSVVVTAKDSSLNAKTYSCTKGADSPVLSISCSHTSGSLPDRGTFYLRSTDATSLKSKGVNLEATWWFKAIPVWEVVLQPWIAAVPDAYNAVVFAERLAYTLPGTISTSRAGMQEFSSTPELPYPDEYDGAFIGHVRVEGTNDVGRPIAYPAETDC